MESTTVEHKKFVTLLRVSTPRQAYGEKFQPEEAEDWRESIISLGIASQRTDCNRYVETERGIHLKEFIEVDSGMEKRTFKADITHEELLAKRPVLKEVLRYAKEHNATIVVAYQSRLTRNAFLLGYLLGQGVKFVSATSPQDGTLVMTIRAAVDEEQGRFISRTTSKALRAKIAREGGHWNSKEVSRENWNKMRRICGRKRTDYKWDHPQFHKMMTIAHELKNLGASWGVVQSFMHQYGIKNHLGGTPYPISSQFCADYKKWCSRNGFEVPQNLVYKQRISSVEVFRYAEALQMRLKINTMPVPVKTF